LGTQLEEQIAGLQQLKTNALKERYRELFGEDSPSSNHRYLVRRIAWRLQAIALGDLSERARARAAEIACDADLRLRPTPQICRQLNPTDADKQQTTSMFDPRIPPVGQTLTREYRGRTVRVTVLAKGFEWDGRVYGSLSAIAWHATGTRWNGYAFFGLNGQVEHA
jgi:hypothetical protein